MPDFHFIPAKAVSHLKKEAKRRQRLTKRPHHELLDELARERAGLPNWHHVVLAAEATQELHRQFKSSLVALFDAKEGSELVGSGFEDALSMLPIVHEAIVTWLRAAHAAEIEEGDQLPTDDELRQEIDETFLLLRYCGAATLPPNAGELNSWLGRQSLGMPAMAWFRGGVVDLDRAAEEAEDLDGGDDDMPASDEPIPGLDEAELRRAFGADGKSELMLRSPETMTYYQIFAGKRSSWHWCLHCERAYPLGAYRQKGEYQMCPYAGCHGDAVTDLWRWAAVRRSHAALPLVPTVGPVYPLYPPTPAKAAAG